MKRLSAMAMGILLVLALTPMAHAAGLVTHYYQTVNVPGGITWDDAKAAAEQGDLYACPSHLATITSPEEQATVATYNPYHAWIGGFQPAGSAEPNGGWQWVTGEPWGYTNWYSGEPNNDGGNENALMLTDGSVWNDFLSSRAMDTYIVEYECAPYQFSGFLQPVDNLPTVNGAKAGSTIPVKWTLQDPTTGAYYSGTDSFVSLDSRQIACESGIAVDDIESVAATGSTTVRWDASANQFVFNWKTSTAWAGQCRELVLTLDGYTPFTANFRFK